MVRAIIETVGAWWFVFAILVAILGVGRWSRLVTYDSFPPAKWWREKWASWTEKHHDWGNLMFCPWCLTPWLMLACGIWFALSFTAVWIAWAWWIFWGWGALSYVASMIIARDEPKDD